jgi:hypothetical protein
MYKIKFNQHDILLDKKEQLMKKKIPVMMFKI